MLKRILICFSFFIIVQQLTFGQKVIYTSQKAQPIWFEDKASTSGYYAYATGEAEQSELNKAKEAAVIAAIHDIGNNGKLYISKETEQYLKSSIVDGVEKVINDFTTKSVMTNEPVVITGLRVADQYYEQLSYSDGRTTYRYSILLRYLTNDGIKSKANPDAAVLIKENYGSKPLYSLFPITGGGQLAKKQKGKGFALLTTSGLLLISAGVSQYLYKDNYDKAQKYNGINLSFYNTYKGYYQDAKTARTFSLIGWSAVYVYSIIDALASHGKPVLASNQRKIQFSPIVYNNSVQFGLNINF